MCIQSAQIIKFTKYGKQTTIVLVENCKALMATTDFYICLMLN